MKEDDDDVESNRQKEVESKRMDGGTSRNNGEIEHVYLSKKDKAKHYL